MGTTRARLLSAFESTREIQFSFGAQVHCRVCESENLSRFAGELTASSLSIENAKAGPVYVCQQVLVCLNCGFVELIIPPQELEKFKRISGAIG